MTFRAVHRSMRAVFRRSPAPPQHRCPTCSRPDAAASYRPTASHFLHLPERYPRAWACFTALAETIGPGGRATYRAPDAPVPNLPNPDDRVAAPTAADDERISVLNAMDPRFDQRLVDMLEAAAFHGVVLWLSALSRISRNLDKLLRTMEFLLAHNATVLTTNYMIRGSDVWVRRRPFVKPISTDPDACLRDSTGLIGAHKKAYEQIAKQ